MACQIDLFPKGNDALHAVMHWIIHKHPLADDLAMQCCTAGLGVHSQLLMRCRPPDPRSHASPICV